MAENIEELVISLKADVAGLKASLETAKAETSTFAKGMESILGELQKAFIEVFAVAKIIEFVADGIKNFASFDQQLEQTIQNIERFDKAANVSRESVRDWGEAIEKTTLFTKDEAVASLNKLVTMTHNFADSQGLAKTAMDFATVAHVDLDTATKALGNAYMGNDTAIRALTRNMPELQKALSEGKDLFVALREQGIEGSSEAIGTKGLGGALNHAKKALDDIGEAIGKVLAGPIEAWSRKFSNLAEILEKVLGFLEPVFQLFGFLENTLIELNEEVLQFVIDEFSDLNVELEFLGPLLEWIQKGFFYVQRTVVALVKTIVVGIHSAFLVLKTFAQQIIDTGRAIWEALHGNFSKAYDIFKSTQEKSRTAFVDIFKRTGSEVGEVWSGAYNATSSAHHKATEAAKGFGGVAHASMKKAADGAKEATDKIQILTKTVTSFQDAFRKEMDVDQMSLSQAMTFYNKASEEYTITLDKNSKTYQTDKERFEKMVKEKEDLVKKAAKVIADQMKSMAQAIGGAIESSFEKMTAGIIKGTMTIGQAFEMLGKNILKSMLGVFGDILIKEGEATMTRGAAAILEGNPVAASGLFASGAMKMAEGGIIKGFAEAALAEGGIVTKPTVALIGEAGPEKVIPLNRAGGAGEGIHINGPLHLPNVRNPREFITELQRMKARAGYRYTSF